jgi:hypothetical protein
MLRAFLLAALLVALLPASASGADDLAVPGGRYFAEGGGFSVTDEAGVPMWSELRRLGGVAALGYPISGRYERDGRVQQALQRAILEWQPDQKQAVPTNVLDDINKLGKDDWLLQAKQTPRHDASLVDEKQRLEVLDARPALRAAYLPEHGLPTSRVVDMGNHFAVRTQRAVLQEWKEDVPWAKAGQVTLANVGDLAKEAGLIPAPALKSASPVLEGRAEKVPWSGWWWPAETAVRGAKLYDEDGPLARYDQLAAARSVALPSLRDWEFANLRLVGGRFLWAGHCNGWAAASILEPEPTAPRTVDGVTFSVADQKGLLSSWHFADRVEWIVGDDAHGVSAAEFHRAVLYWIGGQKKAFIVATGTEASSIDNRPAYRYRVVYRPDEKDPARTHVRTTLWFVDYEVAPDFVGVKHWPSDEGKTYEYFIVGDRANPSAGDWQGARPWKVWYPDPKSRDDSRPLVSPDLDYTVLRAILEGKPADPKPAAPAYLPPPRIWPTGSAP